MQRKVYPSLEEANLYFEYKEGHLYWKARNNPSWDARYAGKEVGSIREGYKVVKLNYVDYFVHKIIFLMHNNGYCPNYVDHKDNNKLNNYPDNLREATSAQNNQNSTKRKDNTSGFKGVSWKASRNCWMVRVQVNGIRKERSGFKTPEEANLVGIKLREELHKEFANNG